MPAAVKATSNQLVHNSNGTLPAGWPSDVRYLADQVYSPAVSAELRAVLGRSSTDREMLERIPRECITVPYRSLKIETITDKNHPAYDQRGLFAAQHLAPSSFICLYVGYVHTNAPTDTDGKSNYDLSFDREAGLSIDATHCGNESRFANDYRGIAERPNAEFRDCLVQVPCTKRAAGTKWERRVGIFVLPAGKAGKRKAGIREGEEVLVSYGKGFWDSRTASMASLEEAVGSIDLDATPVK